MNAVVENIYTQEEVVAEFLRVGALVEAWEDGGCGACHSCEACEALSENDYELRLMSLFFERLGEGELASVFYRRARELEEMPAEEFEFLGARVTELVQEPEVQRSLHGSEVVSRAELEFWGEV